MANNKLHLLLKIENDKEETLRISYLQANQNLQANQQKLQGLNNFRLEYTQQLHIKGQSGLSSAGFSQYHAFIAKIEEAIRQQANTVNTAKQVVSQRKTLWLQQQVKAKAVAKLIEKQQLSAAALVAKNEQKMLDEFTANQFFQRRKVN